MNICGYQSAASTSGKSNRGERSSKTGREQPNTKAQAGRQQNGTESLKTEEEITLEELETQREEQEKEAKIKEKRDAFLKLLEDMAVQKKAWQDRMKKKNVSYDGMSDMAALSSAVDVRQVKAIAARLYLKANNLKISAKESKEAAAALAAIKQVLKKAEVKISRLQEEEILVAKQKSAEREQALEDAEEIKRELEKRRKIRSANEQSDLEHYNSNNLISQDLSPITPTLSAPTVQTAPPVIPAASGTNLTTGTGVSGSIGATGGSVNLVV